MTELEKIAYAKTYIEKLANGINPLTDQPVSDADSINNVRAIPHRKVGAILPEVI